MSSVAVTQQSNPDQLCLFKAILDNEANKDFSIYNKSFNICSPSDVDKILQELFDEVMKNHRSAYLTVLNQKWWLT